MCFSDRQSVTHAHAHAAYTFENRHFTLLDSIEYEPIFVQFMTFMSVGDMEWQITHTLHSLGLFGKIYVYTQHTAHNCTSHSSNGYYMGVNLSPIRDAINANGMFPYLYIYK